LGDGLLRACNQLLRLLLGAGAPRRARRRERKKEGRDDEAPHRALVIGVASSPADPAKG
jgi:hypothetical protein